MGHPGSLFRCCNYFLLHKTLGFATRRLKHLHLKLRSSIRCGETGTTFATLPVMIPLTGKPQSPGAMAHLESDSQGFMHCSLPTMPLFKQTSMLPSKLPRRRVSAPGIASATETWEILSYFSKPTKYTPTPVGCIAHACEQEPCCDRRQKTAGHAAHLPT